MHLLGVSDTWLVSGCLFQTVWNLLDGHPPTRGIHDYDVFYFDPADTSSGTEEAVNQRTATLLADQDCRVDVRNQARVHEWYFEEFGVDGYPKLKKSTDGIDHFLAVCCMVAVRPDGDGGYEIYAPFGVQDVFDRVVQPNPWFPDAPAKHHAMKAERWKAQWPSIEVRPFHETAVGSELVNSGRQMGGATPPRNSHHSRPDG